ncbi:Saccharopine dehydrogenase-domain-containing protein [Phellopilus nigrolimitatus]|nr:Saccharopine dehydrogenase-domain-containing protein [Phellopilus nigrolimitatus]
MVDILVLGATGYTGKLITRYLHVHRERGAFSFAIAGRSEARLAELVAELSLDGTVQVLRVDVTNNDELQAAVRTARVVINTVGPYYRWGRPVVKACARNGVHYVDLTGETPFVRDIIVRYDYLASKTHAVLLPSCGFDAIPSDVAAFLGAKTLRAAAGAHAGVAQSHTMFSVRGGVSGGTLATVFGIADAYPRGALRALQAPYVLSPVQGVVPASGLVFSLPRVRPARYGHVFPFAPHNCAIVQRTWGLLQLAARQRRANALDEDADGGAVPYGNAFSYSESVAAGGPLSAFVISLGLALSGACLFFFPPVRWLLRKLLPAPGQGPSDEALEKGFFKATNISVSEALPGSEKTVVVETTVSGRGDPGYTLSAIMIAECALALLAPERLPALGREGGVLTPMTALGDVLIKRLAASGRFEFESEVREDA